jgi:hypothetical protein
MRWLKGAMTSYVIENDLEGSGCIVESRNTATRRGAKSAP